MESTNLPAIINRQKMNVSSLSLDKDELRNFCDILQERAHSASEIEASLFPKEEQTDAEYESNIQTLKKSFELNITVTGKSGEELWGTIEDVFGSVNFPKEVKSLFVDSESTLRIVHKYYPHNSFVIFLDFNKPKIFDFSLMPSQGTPNESKIEVKGYDATWVNGVFSELREFIDSRSSALSMVHSHSIYDVFIWLLGIPFSFWICDKLSDKIELVFGDKSSMATEAYPQASGGTKC